MSFHPAFNWGWLGIWQGAELHCTAQ